ncbi:phospholipase D-like domain-containing protein [Motilimonas pumila]|uniref:phospholipase D n=1 Tax=Motilimonas pumila TaxID=2303987 RepID=A0A418YKH3_9GAMM|nr:phospholipase D-like domain-containing protein [Motilimonas pumila]RJG51478.1 nuclease [Motilimonas pumila]
MNQQAIIQALSESLEDNKLSNEEKQHFASVACELKGQTDKISFVRNKAFATLLAHGDFNEQQFRSIKWLENLLKTLDKNSQSELVDADACFSPGTDCLNRILTLCNNARAHIAVCVFTISCNEISAALLAAHKRGIKVRIITDNDKRNDKGSDVYHLAEAGIPVTVDRTDYHMHHKFALFDNHTLLSGSFNWTRSATKYNQENILTTDNRELVSAFSKEFERLWQQLS